jgi:DNA-directed RNA polymerase specialized sigma24 family protein
MEFRMTRFAATATIRQVACLDDPCAEPYRDIVRLARRFVRTEEEARDLAQDALMVALERGFGDWASAERRGWLYGVLRKRAAFVARTESRRLRRERASVGPEGDSPEALAWRPGFLAGLPPSLRVVATLASADLSGAEIRWLLRLSPEALRTRLSALRRAVHAEDEPPTLADAPSQPAQIVLGSRRTVLLAGLKSTKLPMVATQDPDGHAIFFRDVAHNKAGSGNS